MKFYTGIMVAGAALAAAGMDPTHAAEADTPGESAAEPQRNGEEVVVTATRNEQPIAEAPATMSVVTGTELRRRPVQDLA